MLLVLTFVLALLWGLARGGRLSNLQTVDLPGYWLALLALALQIGLIYFPLPLWISRPGLLLLSYAALAWFIWRNRRLPGMWLIGAGLLANWVVILANDGFMPVTYEALAAAGKAHLVTGSSSGTSVFGSKDILLNAAETRLWFLADIFVIPPPFPVPGVFSVGDALLAGGTFVLIPALLGGSRPTQAVRSKV